MRLNEVLIMVTVVWTVAFLSANVFICGGHPQAQWSKAFASQKCGDINVLLLWFAVTDVIGDLIILSMPYPWILKLHMNRRKKIGIVAVFLLGTL